MTRPLDDYERLLAAAARLREKYHATQAERFNVFKVLRRAHDEVNLHSRFLAALLDHRKEPGAERRNLADFMQSVVELDADLARSAEVLREFRNVDILIRHSTGAVVIENKIWAEDQDKQLQRYHSEISEMAPSGSITLVYLTLDGREPSDQSLGDLKGRTEPKCVSYSSLAPWLERCGERAYDQPALRESIAQYRRLVDELTGQDYNGAHMTELEDKLSLEHGNLVLAEDLARALPGAKARLLHELWEGLDQELRKGLGLQLDEDLSDITEASMKRFVQRERRSLYKGLYYKVTGHVWLAVQNGHEVYFGVSCHEEHADKRARIEEALGGPRNATRFWPWLDYPCPRLQLRQGTSGIIELQNDERRAKYISSITEGLSCVLEKLRRNGL